MSRLTQLRDQPSPRVTQEDLDRAFATARQDLREVGLIADGKYLDRTRCYLLAHPLPGGEIGFVYDGDLPWYADLVGYEGGSIYIAPNCDNHRHIPGGTLLDTVRHEFGHSWAWLDKKLFRQAWFADTFGAGYWEEWEERPPFDRDEFASPYATHFPAEDFCETFMYFLKYRRSLHRFERRTGLYHKLRTVDRIVRTAVRERVHRIRGPRR